MSRRQSGASVWIPVLLIAALPVTSEAHEKAVLEVGASSVAAGDSLQIRGKDFTAGNTYRLRLLGAMEAYDLSGVTAGAEKTFTISTGIPGTVRPGTYRIVAVAPDGDVVASRDLTVLEPRARSVGEGAPAGEVAVGGRLEIKRSWSGVEWAIIGLVIGLAGGLGIGLLRRP